MANDSIYKVIISRKRQYSMWPVNSAEPEGWFSVGMRGLKQDCAAYISVRCGTRAVQRFALGRSNGSAHQVVTNILARPPQKTHARCRLFCFPYAGGGSGLFRAWQSAFSDEIEVCPIQLPGRERRMFEAPYTSIHTLVADVHKELEPFLDRPFALFGHSLGALAVYELSRLLRSAGAIGPVHMFVSACRGPHVPDPTEPCFDMPDPEFIARLRVLNGTPSEILENEEMLQLRLPVIRADFQVAQTYRYVPEPPLAVPVTVFGGRDDAEVPRHHLDAWREHTCLEPAIVVVPGDHFFIHSTAGLVVRNVAGTLSEVVRA